MLSSNSVSSIFFCWGEAVELQANNTFLVISQNLYSSYLNSLLLNDSGQVLTQFRRVCHGKTV